MVNIPLRQKKNFELCVHIRTRQTKVADDRDYSDSHLNVFCHDEPRSHTVWRCFTRGTSSPTAPWSVDKGPHWRRRRDDYIRRGLPKRDPLHEWQTGLREKYKLYILMMTCPPISSFSCFYHTLYLGLIDLNSKLTRWIMNTLRLDDKNK